MWQVSLHTEFHPSVVRVVYNFVVSKLPIVKLADAAPFLRRVSRRERRTDLSNHRYTIKRIHLYMYFSLGQFLLFQFIQVSSTVRTSGHFAVDFHSIKFSFFLPPVQLRLVALNEPLSGDMGGIQRVDYACFRQARQAGLRVSRQTTNQTTPFFFFFSCSLTV